MLSLANITNPAGITPAVIEIKPAGISSDTAAYSLTPTTVHGGKTRRQLPRQLDKL